MTQDETVALFLGCQAKRAEALKTGKTEDEAHEAARDHWNAWTQQMLDQRKAMEADGRWSAGLENEATRNWFSRALTDFSFCHFLSSDAINEQQEMECNAVVRRIAAGVRQDVQSILVDDAVVSFNNFMFPGHAWFVGSAFSVRISFDHSRFLGSASFKSAIFSDNSSFESASFSGFTSFEGATFSGSSWFNNVAFLDYALLRLVFSDQPSSKTRPLGGRSHSRIKRSNIMSALLGRFSVREPILASQLSNAPSTSIRPFSKVRPISKECLASELSAWLALASDPCPTLFKLIFLKPRASIILE